MAFIDRQQEASENTRQSLNKYLDAEFSQSSALKEFYNEATAKQGVCAGLTVRFAQLYYRYDALDSKALKQSIEYAVILQNKLEAETEALKAANGYVNQQASKFAKMSQFTGLLTIDQGFDYYKTPQELLSVVGSKPGIVYYVGLIFESCAAHALGVVFDSNNDWILFDPNLGVFKGDKKKFVEFLEDLDFYYFVKSNEDVKAWEVCSFHQTMSFGAITNFLHHAINS